MNEFIKYINDYLKDHPEEQLSYWSEYPPYEDKGRHYSIFTHITTQHTCQLCGQLATFQTALAGESGLIFEIEIEENTNEEASD